MQMITITTPFNIDLEFRLASLPKRMSAWLVDMVIITFYYWLVETVMSRFFNLGAIWETFGGLFLIVLPVILYQLAFEIWANGQTPGKKLVGIKVIDREGNEPSALQYVLRWILNLGNSVIFVIPALLIVSPIFILLYLFVCLPDIIVMVATPKNQRIGDLAAGTVVIDAQYKPDIKTTIYQQIEVKEYVPVFPQVMRLTDKDINGIKNLLERRANRTDSGAYMREIVGKIKKVLGIDSPLEAEDFLRQLLYDYNYITGKK